MTDWAGLALALRRPDDDALRSRVPTYVHPLAGRALAWHSLRTLASLEEEPPPLFLAAEAPLDESVVRDLPVEIVEVDPADWWSTLAARLDGSVERLLVVDAAAATLGPTLHELVSSPGGKVVVGRDGPLAIWIEIADLAERAVRGATLEDIAADLAVQTLHDPVEDCLVRDRATLARAGVAIRDRIVQRLMEQGATFLLPETVLVDVDVQIGQDTVIYPGVVLEGVTTIGSETVIGPGCRIIDSWVGSGVELKGWNYIVGTNIRNRAVLEPYVRRGFD